jgi:hypothetical protein
MNPQILLSCSQEQHTDLYPEPDESSPYAQILLVSDPFEY